MNIKRNHGKNTSDLALSHLTLRFVSVAHSVNVSNRKLLPSSCALSRLLARATVTVWARAIRTLLRSRMASGLGMSMNVRRAYGFKDVLYSRHDLEEPSDALSCSCRCILDYLAVLGLPNEIIMKDVTGPKPSYVANESL
jgi:hypothetical protein